MLLHILPILCIMAGGLLNAGPACRCACAAASKIPKACMDLIGRGAGSPQAFNSAELMSSHALHAALGCIIKTRLVSGV